MAQFTLRQVAVALAALAVLGCSGGDDTPRHLRHAPPASGALEDLLPEAAPAAAPAYRAVSRLALRRPQATAQATAAAAAAGFTPYENGTVLLDDGELADAWRFGTDEAGLRAVFGDADVEGARARLADAYRAFLGGSALRGAVADLLASHPTLGAVAPALAWDLDGLRIESISLHDGLWTDAEGDGTLETGGSALTVRMTLPAFAVATPPSPLAACAAVIGDGTGPASLAEDTGRTWVAPAAAAWRWRVALVAHFALADLAPVHDALWDPVAYASQGERDAAAHDLGIFAGFLARPADGLPGSDLVVSVEADPELAHGTLHPVAALAREAGDAACLREVDGWLADVSLLQPALTEGQAAGGAPADYLVHAYPLAVDAADGVVDPGLTCLHDADGDPGAIANDPACATPSGPLELLQASPADVPVVVTPYLRLTASLPRPEVASYELGSCTTEFWKSLCGHRTGRGIKLCLGEWAFRNQVGDYWNIHYWQSPGKAAAQSAIKAGAYVLRGAAYVYLGGGDTRVLVRLAAVSEGSAYIADLVTNMTHKPVAGYAISGYGAYATSVLVKVFRALGVLEKDPNIVASFTVDRVIDAFAQMAEVAAVGWQDYSDASHCRCGFEFRDPDYCG